MHTQMMGQTHPTTGKRQKTDPKNDVVGNNKKKTLQMMVVGSRRRPWITRQMSDNTHTDAWLNIALRLQHSPHAVFRLSMTCKRLNEAFRVNHVFWKEFYARVFAYQATLKHSNYLARMKSMERRGAFSGPQALLRALFAPRCEGCGVRFGHRMLRPFTLRVCQPCLKRMCVSNVVLEIRYGVKLHDFLVAYAAGLGGMILPASTLTYWDIKAFRLLTDDPLDLAHIITAQTVGHHYLTHLQHQQRGKICFFWRPDVERALRTDLHTKEVEQNIRIDAAARLTAYVGRISAKKMQERLMQTAQDLKLTLPSLATAAVASSSPMLHCVIRAQTAASRRQAERMLPHPMWMFGSPYNAVTMKTMGPATTARRQELHQLLVKGYAVTSRQPTVVLQWFDDPAATTI